MTYPTIIVHVDGSNLLEKRVEIAIQIARHENACLLGVAVTGLQADAEAMHLARRRAGTALEHFSAMAATAGLPMTEQRLAEGDAAQVLCEEARFTDLVVLGQPASGESGPEASVDFLQYVALNAVCPVLIVPASERVFSIGDRVLVGWNGSAAAARAMHDAMPFLQQAKQVHLAVATDGMNAAQGDATVGKASAFLSRHGVKAQLQRQPVTADAGHALLQLSGELTADLIVMGCVAHPRGRRVLPGGATRVVLEEADVPVLMSH
ncbi:universal stress protein [Oxalobacteraceae bacterium OM1]|nr:universal stress protein [Oxalobacteraceae bacterium OM1]